MKVDLHIHTSTGSDGALPVEQVLAEAHDRDIRCIAITDHDSLDAQEKAAELAKRYDILYIPGIELNVTLQIPSGKALSLDFLGYGFDVNNRALNEKLKVMREHREKRAREILERINAEFKRESLPLFTARDIENIRQSVDGVFARPHIANYMVKKGIVRSVQEAFERYLVKCDVPKYPLSLAEASELIRRAGGLLVLAHPNDPNGTSLVSVSRELDVQGKFIEENMLRYINGVECWHQRHNQETVAYYLDFAKRRKLITTGGSDCHQKPIVMGTVNVPDLVAEQLKV
jgi:hypothetical protein